jgi:hypothetical protein
MNLDARMEVRLSAEEKAAWQQRAALCGMGLSDFVRAVTNEELRTHAQGGGFPGEDGLPEYDYSSSIVDWDEQDKIDRGRIAAGVALGVAVAPALDEPGEE